MQKANGSAHTDTGITLTPADYNYNANQNIRPRVKLIREPNAFIKIQDIT